MFFFLYSYTFASHRFCSRLPLRPSNPWINGKSPVWWQRAKDTEKAGKSYKSSYSKHCPAAKVGVGTPCVDGRPDRPYSSHCNIFAVLKMVSFLLLTESCKSRTLSSTAQLQWNLPFHDPQARPRRSWSDSPGCGTSWRASSYWCVSTNNRQ